MDKKADIPWMFVILALAVLTLVVYLVFSGNILDMMRGLLG